jgi:hypothetical protein
VATRESINRVKIEKFRFTAVIDNTETIYQGDALKWDSSAHVLTKAGPSATTFVGIAETNNPIATLGDSELLGTLKNDKMNVIQEGLVERIAEIGETLYGFDQMTVGSDAQKACKLWATNSTAAYVVDPKWAGTGKTVVAGDLIKVWIKPRAAYALTSAAAAALT